jgi:hypothetical protein
MEIANYIIRISHFFNISRFYKPAYTLFERAIRSTIFTSIIFEAEITKSETHLVVNNFHTRYCFLKDI